MKNFYNKIEETLKVSTARKYTKGWDKEKHAHMFPDGKYRIYLKMPEQELPFDKTKKLIDVEHFFFNDIPEDMGIDANKIDFEKGTVGVTGSSNNIRIGKVFNRLLHMYKKQKNEIIKKRENGASGTDLIIRMMNIEMGIQRVQEIQKKYNDEMAKRGGKRLTSDYLIVISRHPYDVAGMSTDRDWTSCQNLGAKAVPGENPKSPETQSYSSYVKGDIEEGTLIAYMIRKEDKNIKCPLGRALIKPYFRITGGGYDPSDDEYCLGDDEWNFVQDEYAEEYRKESIFEFIRRNIDNIIKKYDKLDSKIRSKLEDEEGDVNKINDLIITAIEGIQGSSNRGYLSYAHGKWVAEIYDIVYDFVTNEIYEDVYEDIDEIANGMAYEAMSEAGYVHIDNCEGNDEDYEVERNDAYYKLGKMYNIPSSMKEIFGKTVNKWLREKQPKENYGGKYAIAPKAYSGDNDDTIDL